MGPDAETVSKRSGPCVTPECEGTEWVMTTAPVGYQVGQGNPWWIPWPDHIEDPRETMSFGDEKWMK